MYFQRRFMRASFLQSQKTKMEITSKGIAIIDIVIWTSGVESFYFEDSENNVLEIVPDQGIWPQISPELYLMTMQLVLLLRS
jgi:hypothetical protein